MCEIRIFCVKLFLSDKVYTNDKEKGCHYSLSELEFACDKSRLYFEGKRKSRTLFTDKWTEVVKTLSREQGNSFVTCHFETIVHFKITK